MRNKIINAVLTISLLFGMLFIPQHTVKAAAGIALDGYFNDWAGKPCVSDPNGDASPTLDLINFCFISDLDTQEIYFMFERSGSSNAPTDYVIRLDINNDGDYNDPEDRLITINYNLSQKKSMVDVNLSDGTGGYITTMASKANWGSSSENGGNKVELYATFADLGILPGVAAAITMDMYSGSYVDTLDTPVTWTPANALGYVLLGVILIAGCVWMAKKKGYPKKIFLNKPIQETLSS